MDKRDKIPWPIIVMLVLAAALSFAFNRAIGHEEPTNRPVYVNTDSIQVILEIDADGDGHWEIRHKFDDKDGVWNQSASGMMRVTYTKHYTVGQDTTDTDLGYFWRDLLGGGGENGAVDLEDFAAFGATYGSPKITLPSGMKMWDRWYIERDTLLASFGDSTLVGTFYYYPAPAGQ